VPLRKESQRGLLALAVLFVAGLGAFAAVASAGSNHGKDAAAAKSAR
jgi:hypothetical protein